MNALAQTLVRRYGDRQRLEDGRSIHVIRGRRRAPEPKPEPPACRTKARDSALIYAENRLQAWARWAREHRGAIGYPTISALYRAMQTSKVGIVRGGALPEPVVLSGDQSRVQVAYPNNAFGVETRCMHAPEVGEAPEAVIEVDRVVAVLPKDLHTIIVADYFTYGPIEERCKRTRWRRARYSQLLEAAKYAVYVALMA